MSNDSTIQIVVVGGSYGGVKFANEFIKKSAKLNQKFQITVVERRDKFHHVVGDLRALTDVEFAKKLWIPYTNLFKANSGHKVIQAHVSEVHADHVLTSSGLNIPFDYLVLATGALIPAPGKLNIESSAEGQAALEKVNAQLKVAKSIVIVGGGAVGCEMAGEIQYAFPTAKLTLIEANKALVDYGNFPQAFKKRAKEYLTSRGVDVILGEKIDIEGLSPQNSIQAAPRTITTSTGKVIESDLQFFAVGAKVNTPYLDTLVPKDVSSGAFDLGLIRNTKTGVLQVEPTLQLAYKGLSNIFALGDASNADPVPTSFAASAQAAVAAANIVSLIQKSPAPLAKYSKQAPLMMLSMSPAGGVVNLPMVGGMGFLGNALAKSTKSKDLFAGMLWKELNLTIPA